MVSTQLPGIHNEDILLVIFSYLPTLDLARCAAVCKHWYEVVTGSNQIWKGKRYTSNKSPRISAEMRAVLFALPLLQKAEVEEGAECYVNFSYPCLSLTVGDNSDLRAVRDWRKVRCTYLSLHVSIAEYFFSSHSPIDFSVLQKLNIAEPLPVIEEGTRAECAISCALQLCLNVRELSICVDSLSADYLDALEGMSHLRTITINSAGLEKLVFLRHCSEVLEELELEECYNVPSAAYAELWCLGNLRTLRLCGCFIEEGDMEVAAPGLRSLVSLELSNCDIPDLSFLRHCGRLREVSIVVGYICQTGRLPTGLGHMPASVRSLRLSGSAATADDLSEALPCLSSLYQLRLFCVKLDRLDFLRGCPQLRHLRLNYLMSPNTSELLNLRYLSQLETLEMPGYSDDLAFLSTVIPSLPQLDTLLVEYEYNADYVLQDFPRLHSLSLFDKRGNRCDISQLGKLDFSFYGGKYVCKFVREVV